MKFFIRLILVLSILAPAFAQKFTPEELIAKNIAAIGDDASRAAAKTRTLTGAATMAFLRGGTGGEQGPAKVTADGPKFNVVMQFSNPNYSGENISTDGQKTDLAAIGPTGRSRLGAFLYLRPEIIKEGLFGGVLSNNWSLLDVNAHHPNLRFMGMKKVEGKQLLALRYLPKRIEGEEIITIYFDPETFRHVMTEYNIHVQLDVDISSNHDSRLGGNDQDARYTLRETFSEFRTVNGVTLPAVWDIDLSMDGRVPWRQKWTFTAEQIATK